MNYELFNKNTNSETLDKSILHTCKYIMFNLCTNIIKGRRHSSIIRGYFIVLHSSIRTSLLYYNINHRYRYIHGLVHKCSVKCIHAQFVFILFMNGY